MSKTKHSHVVQQHTLDEAEAPSEGVYSLVAVIENCSPLDLTPLAKTIDTDALDALLAGKSEGKQVSFEYCGYNVTATPDEICVEESTAE